MPLFSHNKAEVVEAAPVLAEEEGGSSRRGSIFSRRHAAGEASPIVSSADPRAVNVYDPHNTAIVDDGVPRKHHSMLHRSSPPLGSSTHAHAHGHDAIDSSITAARDRVIAAERAEREAQRVLHATRLAVEAAHEHVRKLEAQMKDEVALLQRKVQMTNEISERHNGLGRIVH